MANANTKKFSNKLRQERERRGVTQEELALKAGVSRNFIGMIERGEKTVTLTKLFDIAKALDIEAWQLIKF